MNSKLEKFYVNNNEKEKKLLIEEFLLDYQNTIDEILDNILNKKELRSNAYILNLMSRKKKIKEYLVKKFKREHFEILINDIDPKTRKNTYILMGNYLNKDFILDLIRMLKKETVNYCISSLILTLGNYNIKNIGEILDKYKEILDENFNNKLIEKVHYDEILNSIDKVLGKKSKNDYNEFSKLDREVYLFLTCMEPLINATFSDVKNLYPDAKKYKDGILIKTNDLDKVYTIRTFYEALITHNKAFDLTLNEARGNIISFLRSDLIRNSHIINSNNFSYRIEFVTTKNKQEKLDIYKYITESINKEFDNYYVNNPSRYEFEIRIIEHGDKYDVFYKLYTYKDTRYDYRIKDLPASINPVSAAIMLNEVKSYLSNGAKVLDAFCGTSTMLIERSYLNSCELTGTDIDVEAIDFSKINSNKAKVKINLYNIDCLDHIGAYDEIISNMPYGNRVSNHKNNEKLYKNFINRLEYLLRDNGIAILLTTEISLMKNLLKNNKKLKLVKDIFTETGGLNPHLFVIKKV